MEDIDKNSPRYANITNILIEMGYKLVHQGKNKDNKESWKFVRDGEEMEINENTIEENYILSTEAFLARSKKRMEQVKGKIKLDSSGKALIK
ncbi:MAG: hypothetical protein ACXVNM_01580 [Bacteroidia bacterium]